MRKKEKKGEIDNSIFENFRPPKKRVYYGFSERIILFAILSVIFLFAATFLLMSSYSIVKFDAINYRETSNIDYKVYLKENEFFTEEYLGKDRTYVASLIKNIDVDFNYQFNIDHDSTMEIDYKIIGKLSITSPKDNSVFFERDYVLLDTVHQTIDKSDYVLKKNIIIDYDYYNNLANKFKYNYGLDSNSKLTVYLEVNEDAVISEEYDINNSGIVSLNIPLSEKAVNINLDYKDVNKKKKIAVGGGTVIYKRRRFIVGLGFLGAALLFVILVLRLVLKANKRKSKYDVYIKKILKEYDRLIVNTKTPPNTLDYNVIKIDTFDELLDARDNTKGAIKYYVVIEHIKSIFYFTHNQDIYILTLKAVDFETNKKLGVKY